VTRSPSKQVPYADHTLGAFDQRNGKCVLDEQTANIYYLDMDEGRKRVLAIVAGILVARHLKTTEDLFDSR
jgi:hypothetical protein